MKTWSLNCFSPLGGSWKWKVKVKMERLLFHNGAFCPWVWRIGSDVLATTHLNLLTSKSIKRNHPTTTNHSVTKSKNNFCLLATLCGDARKFLWNPLGVCAKTLRKHWWSNIYFSSVHSPFIRLMVKLFVFFCHFRMQKVYVSLWLICLFVFEDSRNFPLKSCGSLWDN